MSQNCAGMGLMFTASAQFWPRLWLVCRVSWCPIIFIEGAGHWKIGCVPLFFGARSSNGLYPLNKKIGCLYKSPINGRQGAMPPIFLISCIVCIFFKLLLAIFWGKYQLFFKLEGLLIDSIFIETNNRHNIPPCGTPGLIFIRHWQSGASLTHWGWDKIIVILQMTFSEAFPWKKVLNLKSNFIECVSYGLTDNKSALV